MKVFVFGAGASVASQEGANIAAADKAPLVDNLFDVPYRKRALQLGFSMSDLEEYLGSITPGTSLEKYLTDRWDGIQLKKTEQYKNAERKSFGKLTYYLWWLMQKVSDTYTEANGYRIFLKKLLKKDEEFGIISFNYDTLLDRAIEQEMSHSFIRIENYIDARYIKVHGSVNWLVPRRGDEPELPRGEHTMDYMVRYNHASGLLYNQHLDVDYLTMLPPSHSDLKSQEIITSARFNHQYFFPLILLPLTSKLYGQVKGFRERIITHGINLLKHAREVYFIGYKAADDVMHEMFQNVNTADATVHVIGKGEAGEIMERILSWKPGVKKGLVYDDGFRLFIANHLS